MSGADGHDVIRTAKAAVGMKGKRLTCRRPDQI